MLSDSFFSLLFLPFRSITSDPPAASFSFALHSQFYDSGTSGCRQLAIRLAPIVSAELVVDEEEEEQDFLFYFCLLKDSFPEGFPPIARNLWRRNILLGTFLHLNQKSKTFFFSFTILPFGLVKREKNLGQNNTRSADSVPTTTFYDRPLSCCFSILKKKKKTNSRMSL